MQSVQFILPGRRAGWSTEGGRGGQLQGVLHIQTFILLETVLLTTDVHLHMHCFPLFLFKENTVLRPKTLNLCFPAEFLDYIPAFPPRSVHKYFNIFLYKAWYWDLSPLSLKPLLESVTLKKVFSVTNKISRHKMIVNHARD